MKRLLRAIVPLAIVGGGLAGAAALYASRPQAAPIAEPEAVTHVETIEVAVGTHTPTIAAMGIVTAEKQVAVAPEVAGRVIEQNTALVPGGRIAAGDPLVRIDARDYSLAVDSMKADLAQAQLQVREEATLRRVAEHEWRDRPEGFSEETLQYALREPHIDAAKARVLSARSRIAKAKRDLGRTILRAPFDAVVLAESVDIGQSVGPAAPIATLAGIDRYWVQVSIPVSYLALVDIPDVSITDDKGSAAVVLGGSVGPTAPEGAAGSGEQREGYVVRLHGSIDERGRMAQLFVAVEDPLGRLQPVGERALPLLLGTHVRVEIQGRALHDVVVLPRRALRNDESVWTLDADNRLRRREVEVAWREPGTVVVREGLAAGDRVVSTPLAVATEGMKVELSPETGE
jgi:RND family efflux transporter MFP subunit